MDNQIRTCLTAGSVITLAKEAINIVESNEEMTEPQIAEVMRYIGCRAPDTVDVNGELFIGKMGIEAMIFLTIIEFPWYYEKYELWQRN